MYYCDNGVLYNVDIEIAPMCYLPGREIGGREERREEKIEKEMYRQLETGYTGDTNTRELGHVVDNGRGYTVTLTKPRNS